MTARRAHPRHRIDNEGEPEPAFRFAPGAVLSVARRPGARGRQVGDHGVSAWGHPAGDPDVGTETVRSLLLAMRRGERSPREIFATSLHRAQSSEEFGAFLWIDEARPLAAGPERRSRDDEWLAGLPLGIKDNIDTSGVPTTAGSWVDRSRVPERDAAVWARLRRRGAVLLGKTHLSEFAYGGPNPRLPMPRNPQDPRRNPGSSSSGSAIAVAAGLVPGALGTDTGGSVRQPAAYCGVVGLKPTYDLIERDGVRPLSWTLDHVGILARTVTDAAILLQGSVRGRPDLVDRESLTLLRSGGRIRVGVDETSFVAMLQSEVGSALEAAGRALERGGLDLVPVTLPDLHAVRRAHTVILLAEAWSAYSARIQAGEDFGPAFREGVQHGKSVTAEDYLNACRHRTIVMRHLGEAFRFADVILTPTCPTTAPFLDELEDPLIRQARYHFTRLANFCGTPAISVPAGRDSEGMPIGLQLMGRPKGEALILEVARLLEDTVYRTGSSPRT